MFSQLVKSSFFLLLLCIVIGTTYADSDVDAGNSDVGELNTPTPCSACPYANKEDANKMFEEVTKVVRQTFEDAMTKTPSELIKDLIAPFEQISFTQIFSSSLVEMFPSAEEKCTVLFLWDPKVLLKRIKIKADENSHMLGVLYSVEEVQTNVFHVFNGKYKMIVDSNCDLSKGKVMEFNNEDLMIHGKSVIKIIFPEIAPKEDSVIERAINIYEEKQIESNPIEDETNHHKDDVVVEPMSTEGDHDLE